MLFGSEESSTGDVLVVANKDEKNPLHAGDCMKGGKNPQHLTRASSVGETDLTTLTKQLPTVDFLRIINVKV